MVRSPHGADRHRCREGAIPAEPSSPRTLAATSAATPEVARLLGGCEGAARVAAKGSSRVAAKKQRALVRPMFTLLYLNLRVSKLQKIVLQKAPKTQ